MKDNIKNFLKHFFFSLGIAIVLVEMQNIFESDYITIFLQNSLITILVALLAINCTTLGIISIKLREIMDVEKAHGSFDETRREMLLSVKEQITLIGASLLLLVLQDSKWFQQYLYIPDIVKTLIVTAFVYAIVILYDTAKSVFVILEHH